MERRVNMAVIDPWSKLDSKKPEGMSKTDFISMVLDKTEDFARKTGINFVIVAHPSKPGKTASGKTASCTLYDIEDSRHWFGKVDNGFIISRSWDDKLNNNHSKVVIAKIKDDRYGFVGECNFELTRANRQFNAVEEFKNGRETEEMDL